MKKDLVFVASGGRTGTTFFGERMQLAIEDCWAEHTPDMIMGASRRNFSKIRQFGLWHMVIGRALGLTGMRPLGQKRLAGKISDEKCVKALRKMRRNYHAGIQESLIVESYSRWWMFADLLHEVWPDAKLIGVIRDPRDWAPSWQRHQPRRQTNNFLEWFPLGPLTPKDIGDADWAERWDELDQFGRLLWDWRTINGALHRASIENPNVRMYRFEDLFGGDGEAMRDLVAFAADHPGRKYVLRDLRGFTDTVKNASKGPRVRWRDWPPEKAKLLDDLCGPLMRDYGYGLEPEWKALLRGESARGDDNEKSMDAVA